MIPEKYDVSVQGLTSSSNSATKRSAEMRLVQSEDLWRFVFVRTNRNHSQGNIEAYVTNAIDLICP